MSVEAVREAARAAAVVHPACGSTVYLDQSQCERFEVDYFGENARTVIAASTILGSKDYDEEHKSLLQPLRSGTVVLQAAPAEGPGWFTITAVFAPFGGVVDGHLAHPW